MLRLFHFLHLKMFAIFLEILEENLERQKISLLARR